MKLIRPNVQHYSSVDKIASSYDTMKDGVAELAGQVKADADKTATLYGRRAVAFLKEKSDLIRSEMSSDLKKVKAYVHNEPAKSVAVAFVAGVAISALLRRR